MDARAAQALWAFTAPAWPLEAWRTLRFLRIARREALTTQLRTPALLQALPPPCLALPGAAAAYAARTALTHRRLGRVLAAGVALEALTAAAEQDARFAGAPALRAAAAGGSAAGARALLRAEVVAPRLHHAALARALLLRGLAGGVLCAVLAWLGAHQEQRLVPRPFGATLTSNSYRAYLGAACALLGLAFLSALGSSYSTLRSLGAAIDALGCLPQAALAAAEAGQQQGAAPPGVALNPLAAAAAAAAPGEPQQPPAPPGAAAVEWAAPRAPPAGAAAPAPPLPAAAAFQTQTFAQAVAALGATIPRSELPARWAAALADLRAVRERERARALGEAAALAVIGAGGAAAVVFALTATSQAQFRWFTGAAFLVAWALGLAPALAAARSGVEAELALGEAARVAAAGLGLGAYIAAPPACSARGAARALLCPCRLMRPSPAAP